MNSDPRPRGPKAAITALVVGMVCALALALAVLTAPSARANGTPGVTNLRITAATSNTLTAAWSPVSSSPRMLIAWDDWDAGAGQAKNWSAWYPAKTSGLTFINLHPGHRYRIQVMLEGPYNGAGIEATTTRIAAQAPTCARQTVPTTTTATFVRVSARTVKVSAAVRGPAQAWVGAKRPQAIVVQHYDGRAWREATRLKSGTTWSFTSGRGTFRAVYLGDCSVPAKPSTSGAVTR